MRQMFRGIVKTRCWGFRSGISYSISVLESDIIGAWEWTAEPADCAAKFAGDVENSAGGRTVDNPARRMSDVDGAAETVLEGMTTHG